MEDIRTRPLSAVNGPAWQHSLPQALVLVVILVGLLIYAFVPFLALSWIPRPFIGGFVEQTMLFNGIQLSEEGWPAYRQGVTTGDRLLSIDGRPVRDVVEMKQALAPYQVGDPVTLQVQTPRGATEEIQIRLAAFPLGAQLTFFYFPYLVGLLYLVAAVWVFAIRRGYASGRAFSLFSVSVALTCGLLFDAFTTHFLTGLWTVALGAIGGSSVALVLLFPREDPLVKQHPRITWLAMIFGLALAALALTSLYDFRSPPAYWLFWRLETIFIACSLIFLLAWSYFRGRTSWPNDREQGRLITLAALVSFAPLGLWFLTNALFHSPGFSPVLILFLAIFPIVSGYTVQRYRMVQSDVVLSLGLQYGLLSILVVLSYALLSAGLGLGLVSLGLGRLISPDGPLITGLIFFLIAVLLVPLREWIQDLVNRVFFRGKRAYQDRLQTFSGELTRVVDLPGILSILRRYVEDALTPSRLHLFIYDPLSDQYIASPGASGQPTSDLRFLIFSALAIRLSEKRKPLTLSEYEIPARRTRTGPGAPGAARGAVHLSRCPAASAFQVGWRWVRAFRASLIPPSSSALRGAVRPGGPGDRTRPGGRQYGEPRARNERAHPRGAGDQHYPIAG